ncbi:Holliday junction branch migration DNA helicase RuvB [Candidatus Similichlamydia laticola]|uniref:Holliday junction branch migration complex subunit RuvB n=1 Tax=Candidatus Similichlamydia laticola TaxID=2170265 RepID=A0A369KA58_9BACT|nr:Holliday junction branch migration DNA helicase RuvB [Candidatus Similichlamydia laticola]RDB31481.1 Holliday junction DNA helicase RuvB [Candidatus Similichlamydia laticola]
MSHTCLFSCRGEDPPSQKKKKKLKKAEPIIPSPVLLPSGLRDIRGQRRVVQQLNMLCSACLKEYKPLPHLLFCGPPGLGKTTFARLLAYEMKTTIEVISCSFIHSPSHLVSVLSHLKTGDILFLDEMHAMNRSCSESLYHAMDHFALEILLEKGKTSRPLVVPLNPFTLIGATTHPGRLCKPFLSRFEAVLVFEDYTVEELMEIVLSASEKWDLKMEQDAAEAIAIRSRGTPRLALHFLKWSRRFLLSSRREFLSEQCVLEALELLGLDAKGLNSIERKILEIILNLYEGGPVGAQVLASHIGESVETLEEVYEPHLLREGFLIRSSRGRCITKKGKAHFQG